METLRNIVVLIHLIGFAVLFGGWLVEAVMRRFQATRLMEIGLLIAGASGLILAAPWPAGIELNYAKIGVKLAILVIIGALTGISRSRAKKGKPLPVAVFWITGVLIIVNATLAVLW